MNITAQFKLAGLNQSRVIRQFVLCNLGKDFLKALTELDLDQTMQNIKPVRATFIDYNIRKVHALDRLLLSYNARKHTCRCIC